MTRRSQVSVHALVLAVLITILSGMVAGPSRPIHAPGLPQGFLAAPQNASAWLVLLLRIPGAVGQVVISGIAVLAWFGLAWGIGVGLYVPDHTRREVFLPLMGFAAVYAFGLLAMVLWSHAS
jgi:hypothetical protein